MSAAAKSQQHNLSTALLFAESVVKHLKPYCQRIEIAGSIRRKKPLVSDIEIVCTPQYQKDLFGNPTAQAVQPFLDIINSELWRALPHECIGIKPDAHYFKRFIRLGTLSTIQVDIFTTPLESFGWTLLYRTGPADFNRNLLFNLAKKKLQSRDNILYDISTPCPTPISITDEKQVFERLGIDFIEPENRK